jgi:hypothetical protein
LLVLLGTATVLANLAIAALAGDQRYPAPASILLLALAFSQTSLLALFLGLATAPACTRVMVTAAGIAVWVLALGRLLHAPYGHTALFLVLQAAVVALAATVARGAGLRWSATVGTPTSVRAWRGRQVTLIQGFGWTTLVALLVALGRHMPFPEAGGGPHPTAVLLANAAVGLAAAWTAATGDRHLLRPTFLVALAAGLGLVTRGLAPADHGRGADVSLLLLQAFLVVGWLGAARAAGLHIGRGEGD